MTNKPVLQRHSTGRWFVKLEIFDHHDMMQYTSNWSVALREDFRRWLSQTDPDCDVVLHNRTTLIVTFSTDEGAFAFKLRHC